MSLRELLGKESPWPRAAIPSEVKVGAYTYRIATDKATLNETQVEHGQGLYGALVYGKQLIVLDVDSGADVLADTVLHEVLHSVFRFIRFDDDEDLVARMTPVLLGVLRDNPDLVRFLTHA
ncbi:MAG TPA: hypothetical protein VJQ57_09435 [Acidimicrobiia bacterium]|nr:hypothetical protein [Acidimicrobiia bacterium]